MRRAVWLAAVLAALCLFTACSPATAEELLRAPQLSSRLGVVQKALNDYLGEAAQLKYPREGDTSSPFLFGDLDGDGTEEAVVLYQSSAQGLNVRLAVLEQREGNWFVTQELEGPTTEVAGISQAALRGYGHDLVVVYAAPTSDAENYLAVYSYQDKTIREEFVLPCSQYLVQDVTGSGSQDLVLARRRGEGLVLTLFTSRDGELVNTQDLALDPRFYSCEQLLYSASPHGHYIVMDGTDQSGYTISDLVCYDQESGQLRRAVEGESLAARTARLKPGLYSCDINGDGTVEIPVVEQEITTEDSARRLSLITWRDFTRASSTVVQFGVLDMEYGFFLRLPVAWMGDVTVSDGPALDGWQVTSADGSLWYLRVLVCSREGAIPGAAREYSQICLLGQNRLLVQENESYLPEGWTAEGLYIL